MKKLFVLMLSAFLAGSSINTNSSALLGKAETNVVSERYNTIPDVIQIKEITKNAESYKKDYEEVTLAAVGDNLIHSTVIKNGKTETGYDFTSMYSEIKDYLNNFDIKVINQETVLINDASQYSGYPTFGSPVQVGEAVKDAGFNLVTQATNHAYDKKEQGILDSIAFWNSAKIPVVGIHNNPEDKVFIYETQTMKIAILNYTYSLNGFKLPTGKEYMVDDLYNTDKILSDLAYAKENADFTIVFPHWGTEYTHTETAEQQRLAQFLADNGADLIIGCHPHVIEPLKTITASDGRKVPCYYSLGNFVSAQNKVPRMLGAIAEVKIVNNNGHVYLSDAKMTPIVTYINQSYRGFKVYLLKDFTNELAATHRLHGNGLTVDKLNSLWNEVTANNTFPKKESDN